MLEHETDKECFYFDEEEVNIISLCFRSNLRFPHGTSWYKKMLEEMTDVIYFYDEINRL